MGVILAVGRLGSVINDNISALLPIRGAYWVAAAMCALSTLSAWGAVWLDAAYTRQRQKQRSSSTPSTMDSQLKALAESHDQAVASAGFWESLRDRCIAVGMALQKFDVSIGNGSNMPLIHLVSRRSASGCLVWCASLVSPQ